MEKDVLCYKVNLIKKIFLEFRILNMRVGFSPRLFFNFLFFYMKIC